MRPPTTTTLRSNFSDLTSATAADAYDTTSATLYDVNSAANSYLAWCKRRGIRPRFGAVGRHGSIAVIERFIRSFKDEATRRLRLVPLAMSIMRAEVDAYACWYNRERPHQTLGGDTPAERLTSQMLGPAIRA